MGEGVYPLSKHFIVVSPLKDDVIYSRGQKLRVTQGGQDELSTTNFKKLCVLCLTPKTFDIPKRNSPR